VAACSTCGFESEGPFKYCPECGARLAARAPAHGQRKIVTVLFCDLVDSTALGAGLDPERQRSVLARYFERMKEIVERHGGTVEKFIGDAVMAVFGVPALHEDDALRAVRAAAEMRSALGELGLAGRIGVMTGEVMMGTEERLATGDAVTVAARLEQAARSGDVLLGPSTLALVRDAADVEPVGELELKGMRAPVAAYRLLRIHDPRERPYDGPFVGRERELALLHGAWQRVRADRCCELVTVAGEAGVGKSRLTAEFLSSIETTALRGRCLPYGEGITYSPVVEVVRQARVQPRDEAVAAAIASLLGEAKAATSAEAIAWAFRKTLEQVAAQQPVIVAFDDIQWGEELFLDLIEHVALLSSGAPILLLCIARPELAERRPAWPVIIRLEPLGDRDVDELIPARIGRELRDKITRAAGGNPLFVEEMLAMAGDTDGAVVVPPTLRALLATRLDQLESAERSVLEWGAVEGEVFHRGAVQALAPEETQVTPRLAALVRKNLIRPDTPQLAGDDGFRFRHVLIRDAAYDAVPKATRADLHVRFASWLETKGSELVEQDELLGYHLERAHLYRAELGMPDDGTLAAAARRHLTAGGRRAHSRQDYGAAVVLFERAAALVPDHEVDLELELEFGEALNWSGRVEEAVRRAEVFAERAAAAGDRVRELCGRVRAAVFRIDAEPEGALAKLDSVLAEALPVFHDAGDHLALYIGYSGRSELLSSRARDDAALEASERACEHAEESGYVSSDFLAAGAYHRFSGTTPVPEVLAWLDANEPPDGRDQFFRAYRAWSLAMVGRFDEARAILSVARMEQAERGGGGLLANLTSFESASVEMLAGDFTAAAAFSQEGFRLLEELGESRQLGGAAGIQAQVLYALDRIDEADVWASRSAELGSRDDIWKESRWRPVRAMVLARRGEHVAAEQIARQTVSMCEKTDRIDMQGDVYATLGEVRAAAGRAAQAAEAFEESIARYERKGNIVMAARTRDRLEAAWAG
jgi:class 3 adenylate cyclase/tetratricopeptide (TPR) repeat protein